MLLSFVFLSRVLRVRFLRMLVFAFVVGAVPLNRLCSTGLRYGVASISRLLEIIGLFCKRAL